MSKLCHCKLGLSFYPFYGKYNSENPIYWHIAQGPKETSLYHIVTHYRHLKRLKLSQCKQSIILHHFHGCQIDGLHWGSVDDAQCFVRLKKVHQTFNVRMLRRVNVTWAKDKAPKIFFLYFFIHYRHNLFKKYFIFVNCEIPISSSLGFTTLPFAKPRPFLNSDTGQTKEHLEKGKAKYS